MRRLFAVALLIGGLLMLVLPVPVIAIENSCPVAIDITGATIIYTEFATGYTNQTGAFIFTATLAPGPCLVAVPVMAITAAYDPERVSEFDFILTSSPPVRLPKVLDTGWGFSQRDLVRRF